MASAAIVDAQSVKGADTVGRATRGYDAGKKVNGRKRHIVVDTLGLLLVVLVTAASVQDRDGGARVLERLRFRMPSVAVIWADGGYAGRLVGYPPAAQGYRRHRAQAGGSAHVRGAAPPLGGGAHAVVDQPVPTAGARLRAAARALRGHGEVGDDRPDGSPAGPRVRAAPVGVHDSFVIDLKHVLRTLAARSHSP